MSQKIRWGILGTGSIAKCFATNLPKSRTGTLSAVGSRSAESAKKFAETHSIATSHGSYDALLADKNVDAIYVCVPHPMHAEWAIKAVRAGKHVLLEKPFTLNAAEAMAVLEEAEIAGVTVMEAFMYRCHPQTAKLVELLKSKAIGDVRLVQATFSFQSGFNPDSRLFKNDLAGGGIMDVGCYPASIVRLIAGAAQGKDFADPIDVKGTAHLVETGVDAYATASLKFAGGIIAQIATGVMLNQDNSVRIFGSEGNIVLPNPWVADREKAPQGKILLTTKGKTEEIDCPSDVTSFTLEADAIGDAIVAKQPQAKAPAMTWGDTLGNIATLDRWRETAGVVYVRETQKGYPNVTVDGSPLKHDQSKMLYRTLPNLNKKVSAVAMGCDNQRTLAHAAIMFDDFFAKGGNTFDTSYIYGGGLQERLLGQWMKLRGVRDQCVVIAKGLHTPWCIPDALRIQFPETLDRLQTDYADIYMFHRDNPDVPVGEFVEVANEYIKAGQIKVYGGSNWSLQRVNEANAYAKAKGLQGFGTVSNNFSLARMVDPVWSGCIAASDADSRKWFTDTQTALVSWSSQARGFFLPGRAAPEKTDDKELTRCWYSGDNFQRLERAKELAKKYSVSPINIALAYVIQQPFPTIALIGPRLLNETRTSLPGLHIELTPDEVKWLNLDA